MSFQRRVGTANRGSIPCVPLDSCSDRMRVLVPLRDGEALWVALLADAPITLEGRAGTRPLRVGTLPAGQNQNLQMIDAVFESDRWMPIGTASVTVVDDHDAKQEALSIAISDPRAATTERIAIVAVTPALYGVVSGLPAPEPTTERDQYAGWRLP